MAHHLFLSIMGTMGSGKTTAARLLAKTLDIPLLQENFQDNAFLPRFYEDMKRWAFHSQTFFLLEKARQLEEIPALLEKNSLIQDTPIMQDVFSYAKAQKELGNMDEEEWRLYTKTYDMVNGHLKVPDLIIYLDASVDVLMERIASRGRSYESSISKEYIALLDKLNKDWIANHKHLKICTIDTDKLDVAHDEQDKKTFITFVDVALQTLQKKHEEKIYHQTV